MESKQEDERGESRLLSLLSFFQHQKPDYEVSKRYVFDQMATRFDFVKGRVHFMLDIPKDLVADYDDAAIVRRLIEADWWTVLQSYPAPGVVTFSKRGFSFSKVA